MIWVPCVFTLLSWPLAPWCQALPDPGTIHVNEKGGPAAALPKRDMHCGVVSALRRRDLAQVVRHDTGDAT